MSKSDKKRRRGASRPERRVSVRGVPREVPDAKKLSQALIALAVAQAEKDAQTTHERTTPRGENSK